MEQIMKLENMEKKEALSRVKAWNLDADDMEVLSVLIPELKESDDERIQKAIIKHFKVGTDYITFSGFSKEQIIAWLEKLGEKEYALKAFKDVDVHKFVKYIERQAKAYELNLPNRSYDIYGFAKDILSWLEKENEQKPVPFEAEHGKYYYCIKDYFSGGKKQASKGDVVQALRGLPIMGLEDASEFFLPVNNIQLGIFKVGDWIVKNDGKECFTDGSYVLQVTNVDDHCYKLSNGLYLKEPFINTYRLWTIEDAKAGDVLVASDDSIFLLKGVVNNDCMCYIALSTDNTITLEDYWEVATAVHPATKEQRDLLFQKMQEAGYEWDSEKMEVKKIEEKTADKVEPKFKVGDTIHEIGERCIFPMVIEEIKDGDYVCDNESSFVNIKFQDKYELVEPKFKAGDWIIRNSEHTDVPVQVIEFKGYYRCELNGKVVTFTFNDVHNDFHLWTIQDAKDGDVLAEHETIVLFKTIEGLNIKCYCTYHYLGYNPTLYVDTLQNKEPYRPATKEQRDLLFQKMQEAGYEWDSEKMEVKKIEEKTADKVEPKFKVGDTIHEIGERCIFPMVIEEIKDGDYVCDNESSFINIVFQDKYELVEPKFKVGDWIVKNDGKECFTDGSYVLQVTNVDNNRYQLSNGLFIMEPFFSTYRLWTIEDAKVGDVLYTASTASNEIFIFKGLTTEGNILCYCSYDSEDKYCEGTHHFIGKPTFMTHPATKEQRDKLEKAITKAGYKWDDKKKELLKKIEQNPADNVEKNAFEWSEQDENNKDLLIDIIRRDLKLSAEEFTRLAGWLTNLQDRLNSRPKSLTHDGTKQMLDKIASYLRYKGYEDESNGMRAFINKDVIGITEFINEISEYLKTNMNSSDPEFIEKFKTFVKTLFYEKESKS